jgi:hypothetical protein
MIVKRVTISPNELQRLASYAAVVAANHSTLSDSGLLLHPDVYAVAQRGFRVSADPAKDERNTPIEYELRAVTEAGVRFLSNRLWDDYR